MKDIDHLLKIYQNNLSNKIKELALPLETHFGITEFIYTFIGHDGKFFALSNQPAPSEFYFSNRFYESTLLIRHPDNYKDSAIMPVMIPHEKQENAMDEKFGYSPDNLLVLFRREKENVHKFLFNTNLKKHSLIPFYINNLSVLESFCTYFLSEWSHYQGEMQKYAIDIGALIGPSFFEINPPTDTAQELIQKMAFLKKIKVIPKDFEVPDSLSAQEKSCLKWIHQGKTLKETASILKLSPRTVEYYFDNIKNKLNCYSKSDVMDKLHYLKMLGVL